MLVGLVFIAEWWTKMKLWFDPERWPFIEHFREKGSSFGSHMNHWILHLARSTNRCKLIKKYAPGCSLQHRCTPVSMNSVSTFSVIRSSANTIHTLLRGKWTRILKIDPFSKAKLLPYQGCNPGHFEASPFTQGHFRKHYSWEEIASRCILGWYWVKGEASEKPERCFRQLRRLSATLKTLQFYCTKGNQAIF